MKIVACHGGITNGSIFKSLCAPLCAELSKLDITDFVWPDAPRELEPPEGFSDFFGEGPHCRWLPERFWKLMEELRYTNELDGAEDTLRSVMGFAEDRARSLKHSADQEEENLDDYLRPLKEMLANDPEINGIMGYSEGAHMAATLLMHEEERARKTGKPSQLKIGIFFCGGPPVTALERVALYDEMETRIETRTLHVIGARDPFKLGTVALWNMCAEGKRTMFDHGRGHTVPRDQQTTIELAEKIKQIQLEFEPESELPRSRVSSVASEAVSLASDRGSVEAFDPDTPPSFLPTEFPLTDPTTPVKVPEMNLDVAVSETGL